MKSLRLLLLIAVTSVISPQIINAQFFGVKTNLAGWATGTLNIGLETTLDQKNSIDLSFYWNPLKISGRSFKTIIIQSVYRKWLFDCYTGHNFSIDISYVNFDYSNSNRIKKGNYFGVGVGYGYSFLISDRWSLNTEIAVGLFYGSTNTEPFQYDSTGEKRLYDSRKLIVSPSRLNIGFTYLF